jgi:DNA replication regulator DPB11
MKTYTMSQGHVQSRGPHQNVRPFFCLSRTLHTHHHLSAAQPRPLSPTTAGPSSANPAGNIDPLASLDEENEEPAAVKRQPAVTLKMWQSMLKPRGFEVQEGKLVRSPSKSQAPPYVPPGAHDSPSKDKDKGKLRPSASVLEMEALPQLKPSVLASFRRSQSFAPQAKDSSTPKQPFQRASSSAVFAASPAADILAQGGEDLPFASSSRLELSVREDQNNSTSIFAGKTFRAMGEARSPAVRQAIEEAGGRLVPEGSDEDVDIVLVRLVRYT